MAPKWTQVALKSFQASTKVNASRSKDQSPRLRRRSAGPRRACKSHDARDATEGSRATHDQLPQSSRHCPPGHIQRDHETRENSTIRPGLGSRQNHGHLPRAHSRWRLGTICWKDLQRRTERQAPAQHYQHYTTSSGSAKSTRRSTTEKPWPACQASA